MDPDSSERQRPGRSLGRAPSTIRGDGTALNFFNTYRRLHSKSDLEHLAYIELEGDNMMNLIADLADFASSTPLPHRYVGLFEPPPPPACQRRGGDDDDDNDKPVKVIGATSLSRYI